MALIRVLQWGIRVGILPVLDLVEHVLGLPARAVAYLSDALYQATFDVGDEP